MKKSLLYTGVISASVAVALSGCTAVSKKNDAEINANLDQGQNFYADRKIAPLPSLVQHSNRVFLSDTPFSVKAPQVLPQSFYNKIVYAASSGEGVEQMLHDLSQLTGVQIRLTDDARSWIAQQIKTRGIASAYNFNDTLEHILTSMTGDYSLSWKYQNGVAQVYHLITQIYALDAPIGNYQFNNSIASSGSAASTGGGSSSVGGNSNMSMNYDIKGGNPWESAIQTIKNMLSPQGKIDASPSEGYITVTDTPVVQAKVNDYIQKVNVKTNKKIAIRVDVYDVQTSADTNFGVQLAGLLRAAGMHIGIASGAGFASQMPQDALRMTFDNSTNQNRPTVLQALNTLGRTARVVGSTVYTVSGQPAPIQSSQSQGYIKSVTRNITYSGTTPSEDVSVQQDTINTGYNLTLTPRLQSNNQLLLNMNLQISTLTDLKNAGAGSDPSSGGSGSTPGNQSIYNVQLPTVHNKSFMETMTLKSGQSLLMAGFQESDGKATTNSMGPEQVWALGGNKATSNTKSTTVVVVTPYIIGG